MVKTGPNHEFEELEPQDISLISLNFLHIIGGVEKVMKESTMSLINKVYLHIIKCIQIHTCVITKMNELHVLLFTICC